MKNITAQGSTLDSSEEEYFFSTTIKNNPVEVSLIATPDELEKSNILERVDKCLEWIEQNESKITEEVCKRLISLKNKTWIESDSDKVTTEEFIAKLKLESIVFYKNGSLSVYYDDGDLFWGHIISVSIDDNFNVVDADIEG